MNKAAFYDLSYGVYVLTTYDEVQNRPTGCVANSAMQVTSDPATIAVSVNHDNYTNECIMRHKRFAISILSETIDPKVIGAFGFRSGRDNDKFAAVAHTEVDGVAVLEDACSFIVCELIDTMETSTHTVFLGKVVEADTLSGGVPMTYAYYHKVVKGKAPKNAPTYIAPEANG